jgi:uncharacterized protein (DUF362 family)
LAGRPWPKGGIRLERNKIYVTYTPDGEARRILEASGSAALFKPGMRVGLKPNLVVAKPASSGATTSPRVVAGVVEFLKDLGVTDIAILEGAWAGESTVRAWQACGYRELEKRYGVRLLDLKSDRTRRVRAAGLEIEVCASPLEADRLVNLPVLKGHCQTGMTCALKNLKGCLPDGEKRRFHSIGLHRPIAALNTVLRPDLILVDALCGDLSFEEGGNPVEMNRLILGTDPVQVDAYGASLLGIAPSEIEHLVLAERLGVGSSDIPSGAVVEVGPTPRGPAPREGQRIAAAAALPRGARHLARYIEARDACSICYGGLVHALYRLEGRGIGLDETVKWHIGQGFKGVSGKGLGVGECASGFETCARGCPPRAEDILGIAAGLRS